MLHICLNKNENTETIIKGFKSNNVSIEVQEIGSLVWLKANLREAGYLSYVNVAILKTLVICSNKTPETIMRISLYDIDTIYELD